MRSLLLVLKIVVTTSLLVHSVDSVASSAKINSTKKGLHKDSLRDSGNVWDRIRYGMQIPRNFPNQILSLSSTQSLPVNTTSIAQKNLLIKTTMLPTSTLLHDDTNRTRLRSVIGADANSKAKIKSRLTSIALQKQIVDYVNTNAPESPVAQNRLRTRIEFHRQADTLNTKMPTEVVAKRELPTAKTVATISTEIQSKPEKPTQEKNAPQKQQNLVKLSTGNERIGKHIAWYSQNPAYLQRVAERARPYLYHIVSQLNANHLPAELALLPIVESAYQPTAQSPKSAAGLWQFIPSTGLDFDLPQNDSYDARLDIDASTQAAIRYLSQLKNHYNGNWLLALAAYNCGQGRVDDAIASNRANGLATDYWSLHLPEETQEYVPRFLALSSIFANPSNYGLKLPAVKNEPYFVKVKVDRKFDIDYLSNKNLSTVAELANLSYEQFVQLNPGYLKPTLDTSSPFTLLLPANNADQLHQHLSHVARFLAEPSTFMVNVTAQKKLQADNAQESLPIATVTSLIHNPPKLTNPLLSLPLDANQTTPRITAQPVFTVGAVETMTASANRIL